MQVIIIDNSIWERSSVWLERMPVTHEVASSSLVVPAIKREPFMGSFFICHPELDSGSIQSYIMTIGIDRFRIKYGMTKKSAIKKESVRTLFLFIILSG